MINTDYAIVNLKLIAALASKLASDRPGASSFIEIGELRNTPPSFPDTPRRPTKPAYFCRDSYGSELQENQ